MRKLTSLCITAFALLLGIASVASADDAADAAVCRRARNNAAKVTTSVFNSYAQIAVGAGNVKGLTNKFCVFQIKGDGQGMIDLTTLASKRPSIAATYLLKGLDVASLPVPGPDENPGTVYCKALAGSSITRYASGGFTSPGGQDEVCVFGDGSKISIWVLVYVSDNPNYLSMRAAVKSQPLDLPLPYIKPGK